MTEKTGLRDWMRAAMVAMATWLLVTLAMGGLGGCQQGGVPPASPSAAAAATTLDEKALAGVELAYKAMRTAGSIAADAGVLDGEIATRVAEIDAKAYAALLLARKAYQAGNAVDYGAAVTEALALIGEAQALISPSA